MEFQLKQQLNYSTCKLNDESKSFRGAKRRKQRAKSRLLDGTKDFAVDYLIMLVSLFNSFFNAIDRGLL